MAKPNRKTRGRAEEIRVVGGGGGLGGEVGEGVVGGRAEEIAVVGEVDDWESEVVKALLEVAPGGECVFYIDSAGGSVFGALAVLTLLRQRRLSASAVVLGECSSAALLLFAACRKRW